MIVSSNKPFSSWAEIFGDAVAVAAMVDRLIHHAEIVSLKGDSYRLKDRRKEWPAPSDCPDFSRRKPSRIQPPLTTEGNRCWGVTAHQGRVLHLGMQISTTAIHPSFAVTAEPASRRASGRGRALPCQRADGNITCDLLTSTLADSRDSLR